LVLGSAAHSMAGLMGIAALRREQIKRQQRPEEENQFVLECEPSYVSD
jgi:hypothetical protein